MTETLIEEAQRALVYQVVDVSGNTQHLTCSNKEIDREKKKVIIVVEDQ